ncbi:hypothetical protein ACS0TY_030838 [Phlomoides rotata]
MDVLVLTTLFVALLLSLIILTSRLRKFDHGKRVQSSVSSEGSKKGYTSSYRKGEVSLHNKRSDCWIIIKEKVYDVSCYVEEHPGGDAILAHAGDDSTQGFFGPQHATRVFDMIDDFYIGDLVSE